MDNSGWIPDEKRWEEENPTNRRNLAPKAVERPQRPGRGHNNR